MADYSTLATLDLAYGENTASKWLTVAITNLNIFCGSKNMNDDQVADLAILLANEYRDMKFSVFQLFFYRFKCGDFGKFYGKVDPMVITCALKEFKESLWLKEMHYRDEEYKDRHAEEERIKKERMERWENCQKELCSRCPDEEGKKVFAALEIYSFFEPDYLLTLKTDREGYELIEGKYIQLFSTVIRRHYPNVKIQYSLWPSSVQQPEENNEHKVTLRKKADAVQTTVESARRIINNELGLDKDTLENMRYSFKLRYKCWPEDYVARYEKKDEVSAFQHSENQK